MGRLRRLAMARQASIIALGLAEARRREEERARRTAVLERLLRNWQSWRAALEDSGVETLVISGEEWNFYDLLDGIKELPPRQKQALWMILVEDMRPVDVARAMFTRSRGRRVVGEMAVQYKNDALAKLVARHEKREEG